MPREDRATVLVAGATGAIGGACCARLIESGYRVLTIGHDAVPGVRLNMTLDLGEADVAERVDAMLRAHDASRLAGVVHVAAAMVGGPVENESAARFDRAFHVNARSLILMARATLERLRLGGGAFIYVGSPSAAMPLPYAGLYAASKGAAEVLMAALSMENRGSRVRFATVLPGTVKSLLWARLAEQLAGARALAENERYDEDLRRSLEVVARSVVRGTEPRRVASLVMNALQSKRRFSRLRVGADAHVAAFLSMLPWRLRTRMMCAPLDVIALEERRAANIGTPATS
jgi:short-subunit dehydrogenase